MKLLYGYLCSKVCVSFKSFEVLARVLLLRLCNYRVSLLLYWSLLRYAPFWFLVMYVDSKKRKAASAAKVGLVLINKRDFFYRDKHIHRTLLLFKSRNFCGAHMMHPNHGEGGLVEDICRLG